MLMGYSGEYIITEYAVYNTYVIGLLIVPTFFVTALSTALLPEISKYTCNKNRAKRIFKKAITWAFLLGLIANIFFYFFAEFILMFIFDTNAGVSI